MRKILRKLHSLFTKFLISAVDIDTVVSLLNKHHIKTCYEQVTYREDTVFYPEATVDNLQGNKSKISIGTNTHIRGSLLIWPYGNGIEIGSNSYIGKNSLIWSGDAVKIGHNVLISHNVTIIDSNSHEIDYREREKSYKDLLKNGHPSKKGTVITAPIIIEDNVWISYNVCILKGVTIHKGAIIAAGSIVTKDVAPFTLFAGNPAVLIKDLNATNITSDL